MSDPHFVELFGDVTDEDIVQEAVRAVGYCAAFLQAGEAMVDMSEFGQLEVPPEFLDPTIRYKLRLDAAIWARVLEVFEAHDAGRLAPEGAAETHIIGVEEKEEAEAEAKAQEEALQRRLLAASGYSIAPPLPLQQLKDTGPGPSANTDPPFRGPNLF